MEYTYELKLNTDSIEYLFSRIAHDLKFDYFDEDAGGFWGHDGSKKVKFIAYFSNKECSLEEAETACINKYVLNGNLELEIENEGYSEWTITDRILHKAMVEGHDLKEEFSEHIGEYLHFIIELI